MENAAVFIIGLMVTLIGWVIAVRNTSFSELKALNEILKRDLTQLKTEFETYKDDEVIENDKNIKKVNDLEDKVKKLTDQNNNFRLYISRLINQLERAGIVPVKMEDIQG